MSELRPLITTDWRLPEKEAFLTDMREAVQGTPYPGYPSQPDRLYIPADELRYTPEGRPILPADPNASYTVFEHSVDPSKPRSPRAFHDDGGPLPPEEAASIEWGDMRRDSRGMPLHCYALATVTDPTIGAIIGPGYYYRPGKKRTVDLGILALGAPVAEGANEYGVTPAMAVPAEHIAEAGLYLSVLTVRRSDTKRLALPGGNIDDGEDALTAALRETREETGMSFDTATSHGRRLVADPRLTTCVETVTELFTCDAGTIPDRKPIGDEREVIASEWLITDRSLLRPGVFFGSHRRMLLEVVDWYQHMQGVTVMENGHIVAGKSRKQYLNRNRAINNT